MKFIKDIVEWVIRKREIGEDYSVSKSAEKFKWFSVLLEFIQNAMDASTKSPVIIKITTTKVKYSVFMKNFLTEKFLKMLKIGKFKPNAEKDLKTEEIDCLILEDFNTTGIKGDPEKYRPYLSNGDENPIFCFNFYVGKDDKLEDPDAGGSEGEGRQTYFYASKISTFFYLTKRENSDPLFYGMTFLMQTTDKSVDWVPILRMGKKFNPPNNLTLAYPSSDKDCIEAFKNCFPIKRKNETGTSVVIPAYETKYLTREKIIAKILEIYRVSICRGQMILEIDDITIDSKNIQSLYKEYVLKDHSENILSNSDEYLNFLIKNEDIKKENIFEINYSKGFELKKDAIPDFEKFIDKFSKNELIKLRCNFFLNYIDRKKGSLETRNVKTYFDLYIQKPFNLQKSFKFNDFVRGFMSIYNIRTSLPIFALLDVSDKEAKRFFKCAEGANHSEWDAGQSKLQNKKFYTETYGHLIRFAKRFPGDLFNLLESEDTEPDFDALSELFPDYSNVQKKKKKAEIKKERYKPPFIPVIYPSLYDWEVDEIKGGFKVKGIKHIKEDIESKIETMRDEKEKIKKFLQSGDAKVDDKNFLEEQLVKIDKTIDKYKIFLDNDADNYPMDLIVRTAFDGENISNPYKSHNPKRHFDFDENKEFNFNIDGDVSIKSCNKNIITLSAASPEFEFKCDGFDKISNYDVKVKIDKDYYNS